MCQSPYVKSNYQRVPGDYYPTIDKRCVYALLQHFKIKKTDTIFDVCAPQGSGIIDTLREVGKQNAFCKPDSFEEKIRADWIITNPPYDRKLVDPIIERQIERIRRNEVSVFACLLRNNFDHAKSRQHIFKDETLYFGQVKMLFRPRWIEKSKGSPIHNYVWHIWSTAAGSEKGRNAFVRYPFVMYADGELHE